jgi:hypothetical protein
MRRFSEVVSIAITMTVASTSIAACGSSGPRAATVASRASHTTAQITGLGYARCMRAHGVSSFPDPSATGGFNLPAAGINQSSPAVRTAEVACRSLLPVKRVPYQAPTAAAYARLLHWAKCMRTHGISGLQDPKPNPPPGPGSPAARGIGTLMGDDGYWVGIPDNVNAHSSGFMQLSTRCGESPSGHR